VIVRKIESEKELHDVYRLTYGVYLKCGYCKPNETGKLIHYPHLDNIPETTVFIAIKDGRIVGTNSITADGPSGLHVDEDFLTEVNKTREEKRRLVASWRIATDFVGISAVIRLIKKTIDYALKELKAETALFTFNPRHEKFYEKYLKMETIGRRDCIKKLENAPAVLMRLDRERVDRREK
jgi:hypothetical protein